MPSSSYDGMFPTRCLYFIICLTFLPSFIGFLCVLTYFSLGVQFLVNSNIEQLCPESYLWEYILVSVIFSPFFYIHYFLKKHTKTSLHIRFKLLIISVVSYLGIIIGGGYILYNHVGSCENSETNIWKFGIASFIIQILYLFYCFVYYLDYILKLPNRPSKPEDEDEDDNNLFIDEYPYIDSVTMI